MYLHSVSTKFITCKCDVFNLTLTYDDKLCLQKWLYPRLVSSTPRCSSNTNDRIVSRFICCWQKHFLSSVSRHKSISNLANWWIFCFDIKFPEVHLQRCQEMDSNDNVSGFREFIPFWLYGGRSVINISSNTRTVLKTFIQQILFNSTRWYNTKLLLEQNMRTYFSVSFTI